LNKKTNTGTFLGNSLQRRRQYLDYMYKKLMNMKPRLSGMTVEGIK